MTARQTTFIGLLAALAIMGGLALYSVGQWFPVPGSKFLVMAPYLGLTCSWLSCGSDLHGP